LKIVSKVRDDIYTLKDLISGKEKDFHIDRLRVFKYDNDHDSINLESSLLPLAAADKDEFVVESIIDHEGSLKYKSKLLFRIRWLGYDESEDTWLPHREVKDLQAFDAYLEDHPELSAK
jgi:hypothetical protein